MVRQAMVDHVDRKSMDKNMESFDSSMTSMNDVGEEVPERPDIVSPSWKRNVLNRGNKWASPSKNMIELD